MISEEKVLKLKSILRRMTTNDTALAFSGGVDSSLLLNMLVEAARENNTKVYAVTVNTELHPACDLEIAKQVVGKTGAIHVVLNLDELTNEQIVCNPVDRCYLCKKMLFSNIIQEMSKNRVSTIIEGTNIDDTKAYRPGIRALEELGIISPLKEIGFTKDEVRELAKTYDIMVHNRPSTPCLATRFPYGTRLDFKMLEKVEKAENILKEFVDGNVRARVHDNVVRIETDDKYIDTIFKNKNDIIFRLKELGYDYVTFDLEGFRSGSMDINVRK